MKRCRSYLMLKLAEAALLLILIGVVLFASRLVYDALVAEAGAGSAITDDPAAESFDEKMARINSKLDIIIAAVEDTP